MTHSSKISMIAALTLGLAVHTAHAQSGSDSGPILDGLLVFEEVIEQTFTGSSGIASFAPLQPVPPSGPINASYLLNNLNVISHDPVYGDIISSRDLTRPSNPTTLTSINSVDRFPVVAAIRFYGEATIPSRPGRFVSNTELLLTATVTSLPFTNVTFVLQEDVVFHNAENPGEVAFTLRGGSTAVTVTGGPDSPPEDIPDGLE